MVKEGSDEAWFEQHIIVFYVVIDEFTKQYGPHRPNTQKMSDAEVLFTALFAAWFCGGKIESARRLLGRKHYIPTMLSKSRLYRRIHALAPLLPALVHFLSQLGLEQNQEGIFLVDTFLIPVCHNIHIARSQIYKNKAFRGYTKSKRSFSYGLKLLLVTTEHGQVVLLALASGSTADITMLQDLASDLPEGSELIADKGFTNYALQDVLEEPAQVKLHPFRKHNAKRQYPVGACFRLEALRKRIETVGSQINALLPKTIHAVTAQGFELKIVFFVLAFALTALWG